MRRTRPALLALLTACAAPSPPGPAPADSPAPVDSPAPADSPEPPIKRVVVLLVGDGMGPGQLEAASLYAHGTTGALFMQSLPNRGELRTATLSGTADSAAAATTLATGYRTYNGRVGLDRDGLARETLVEAAARLGLATGVVTTASLPHATPAAFTAHYGTRVGYLPIADQQARDTRPDVLLGGGLQYFAPAGEGSLRRDAGLLVELEAAGYRVLTDAAGLAALDPLAGERVIGLFAPEHLSYTVDRTPESTEPTLPELTRWALARLDTDPAGFFLLVEGARIDMASHNNDAQRAITETLVFDKTVRAVAAWAQDRPEVTVLVTADHECGGLQVVAPAGIGELPEVAWRWGVHTNARVSVFGQGPHSELFAGAVRDHAWVHAAASAAIELGPVHEPPTVLIADGELDDLRYEAATQLTETGFGAGLNQLHSLRLDADATSLAIGITGLFEWEHNAVVVLIDRDLGAGTGLTHPGPALEDARGRVDGILSSLQAGAPDGLGFGAELALVVWGGEEAQVEALSDRAGLRGLVPPLATPDDLGWYPAVVSFAGGVRARDLPLTVQPGFGLEAHLPWTAIYPDLGGSVPAGATLGLTVVLVNDDGGFTSNQALPPFPAGAENPGREAIVLPGVVQLTVDSDANGAAGDLLPPVLLAP